MENHSSLRGAAKNIKLFSPEEIRTPSHSTIYNKLKNLDTGQKGAFPIIGEKGEYIYTTSVNPYSYCLGNWGGMRTLLTGEGNRDWRAFSLEFERNPNHEKDGTPHFIYSDYSVRYIKVDDWYGEWDEDFWKGHMCYISP